MSSLPAKQTDGQKDEASEKTREEKLALLSALTLSSSTAQAARTMALYPGMMPAPDYSTMLEILSEQGEQAASSDLRASKQMLAVQAASLQTIYTDLMYRAAKAGTLEELQTYMGIALRAQANCRKNIEALTEIVQGRVVFAKNANVATNQQINVDTTARTERIEAANELIGLGHEHDGDAKLAGGGYSKLAALGALDRATNARGKGARVAELASTRNAKRGGNKRAAAAAGATSHNTRDPKRGAAASRRRR